MIEIKPTEIIKKIRVEELTKEEKRRLIHPDNIQEKRDEKNEGDQFTSF